MNIRKLLAVIVAALLIVSSVSALAEITIGVPNDTTNEARALQLLQDNGIIELKEGAGETATKADVIADGIEIVEVQADLLVNQLPDLDYAVINSNFVLDALDAGIEINSALLTEAEDKYLPRANVIAVHGDNVDADLTKALVAAATSQQVKDYIESTYAGAVLSVVDNPTDGYDASVDYSALSGQKVSVAATPTPHAEILNDVVKGILADKGITLEVVEFTDYVQPNNVVDSGEVDANYFQHLPYLEDFNAENGTKVVSIGAIHVEPMGLYGGKQANLDALK